MFKFIVKLLPKKWLVNMLLEVLPELLTQGFTWLMEEYPESVNEVRKLYAKKIQSASNSTSARSSIRAVIARNQKNAKSASPTSVLHEMAY